MKTAKYLMEHKDWDLYETPGDSARLKKYVAEKWKPSSALDAYAETYLPKTSIDLGPIELLSAEDVDQRNAAWDGGDLLSKLGLLEIGSTTGSDYLFMVVDTGQVLFLDISDIPTADMREMNCDSAEIEDFDVEQWISECEENGEDNLIGAAVFDSFAEFDDAFLAWHQEDVDDDDDDE